MTTERAVVRRFRAMNTDVLVGIVPSAGRSAAAAAAARAVQQRFDEIESALSRFRTESELSRLNRMSGQPVVVSDLLWNVLSQALRAAAATGGLFDPTILPDLLAAGYDRSFELLAESGFDDPRSTPGREWGHVSWRDVEMNPDGRTVSLPAGAGIDLGGIGKGWAVDAAIGLLEEFDNCVVDAGGDMYVKGNNGDGKPWMVGVQSPFAPDADLVVLPLHDMAIATSTTVRRRWQKNGRSQHHLIDPRTGRPSESPVVAATVLGQSVVFAEIWAKAALLLGPEEGLAFLAGRGQTEGLLVLETHCVLTVGERFRAAAGEA